MPTNVLMPALSPTMTEGNLAKWHKAEGDTVEAGDVIAEIETDKATMEVEAVDEGTLGKILISEGTENVAVNTPIAVLLEDGESADDIEDTTSNSSPLPESSPRRRGEEGAKTLSGGEAKSSRASAPKEQDKGNRIFASPLAKRLAAEKGIDLANVKGSGPRGRIVKADIESAKSGDVAASKAASAPSPQQISASPSSSPDAKALAEAYGMAYTEIPNNNMRKVVAKRLLESKQTVPHFYLTIECRIDEMLAARKRLNEEANGAYKISVNDFVIKACANALKAYPAANVAWTDAALLQFDHADISVAVATPSGLITPIIKKAETKGLRQISEEMKDLAGRSRDGKLKPEEFQGGTFSISNLGMYGVQDFAAIINPPQSCILAVGGGEQKPYVSGGEIKIGTFMKCTLSTDHRSVDGAVGAEFLQILKRYIEDPLSMIV